MSARIFTESFTTAAIDGARISAHTAGLLVHLDEAMPADNKDQVASAIMEACQWLDVARAALPPTETTSVHLVTADRKIVLPEDVK